MKFPFILNIPLDDESVEVWNNIFKKSKGTDHDKTVEQSLWRRNQTERNKSVSGWQTDQDKARKIVFYKHTYDMIDANGENKLALMSTYVYVALTLKSDQAKAYLSLMEQNLTSNNWVRQADGTYCLDELVLSKKYYSKPEDRDGEYGSFPDGYETLVLEVKSNNFEVSNEQVQIWKIAEAGLRKSLPRNNPKYITNISDVKNYFPAQIEMGCGPSYEAGVWPLHTLHEIYSINEPFTKKFIITAAEDKFVDRLVGDTVATFEKTSEFFSRIVTSKLTKFYFTLKEAYTNKYFVGPILTNNLDGLHLRLGLPEVFIRTYDEVDVLPNLQFDPMAKSLLVIGCHADRRGIERRARERGLKIIYIDPEGWWADGEFHDYPLESPQDGDFIYKTTASSAFENLADLMKTYSPLQ